MFLESVEMSNTQQLDQTRQLNIYFSRPALRRVGRAHNTPRHCSALSNTGVAEAVLFGPSCGFAANSNVDPRGRGAMPPRKGAQAKASSRSGYSMLHDNGLGRGQAISDKLESNRRARRVTTTDYGAIHYVLHKGRKSSFGGSRTMGGDALRGSVPTKTRFIRKEPKPAPQGWQNAAKH